MPKSKKPAAPKAKSEHAIQGDIVKRIYDLLMHDVVVAAVPNEVSRQGFSAMREVQKKKDRGMQPGFPDLIVIWRAFTFLIEVKTPRGKVSPIQERVHALIRKHKVPLFVMTCADDVKPRDRAAEGGGRETG